MFVSLFPHLIAGPIVRYKDIADRIDARSVTQADWVYGIGRFITGLAKKVIIADGLSPTADLVFQSEVGLLYSSAAWVGLIAFFFQIYFDFSGYSDMAIGLSRLFGFKLRENFNYPYTSRSITAFWQRWHMTLTGWFRDYLYRPLSSRGQGGIRRAVNTYIVFVLCGLWHGASWTFITFGVYFGTILVAEYFYWARFGAKLPKVLQHLYVLAAIAGGLVFFRSPSMSFASNFMLRLVGIGSDHAMLSARQYLDPEVLTLFFIGALCCTPLPMRIFTGMRNRLESARAHSGILSGGQWAFEGFACGAGALLFVLCACLAASRSYTPFIYFQF